MENVRPKSSTITWNSNFPEVAGGAALAVVVGIIGTPFRRWMSFDARDGGLSIVGGGSDMRPARLTPPQVWTVFRRAKPGACPSWGEGPRPARLAPPQVSADLPLKGSEGGHASSLYVFSSCARGRPSSSAAAYEKGAILLTSNRSIDEWGAVFGDPVVATASSIAFFTTGVRSPPFLPNRIQSAVSYREKNSFTRYRAFSNPAMSSFERTNVTVPFWEELMTNLTPGPALIVR